MSDYVSSSDMGTYKYSSVDIPAGALNEQTGAVDLLLSGSGIFTISVTLDNAGCVSDAVEQQLEIYPSPEASITGATELCSGVSETMEGVATGGTLPYSKHLWTQSGSVLGDVNVQTPSFYTTVVKQYDLSYEVTDANGCKSKATHQIEVVTPPTAQIKSPMPSYCSADEAVALDGSMATVSATGGTYEWFIDNHGYRNSTKHFEYW
ncbi:MAG: hypothetical protein IPO21_04335 [Bacteroidales bacterium]|nr:hypothetical protein [Bacteroidales bacterium]